LAKAGIAAQANKTVIIVEEKLKERGFVILRPSANNA
jgi:hypothetical protein